MAEIIGWGILGNALIARKCLVPAIALDSDQTNEFANDQWQTHPLGFKAPNQTR